MVEGRMWWGLIGDDVGVECTCSRVWSNACMGECLTCMAERLVPLSTP